MSKQIEESITPVPSFCLPLCICIPIYIRDNSSIAKTSWLHFSLLINFCICKRSNELSRNYQPTNMVYCSVYLAFVPTRYSVSRQETQHFEFASELSSSSILSGGTIFILPYKLRTFPPSLPWSFIGHSFLNLKNLG